MPTTLFAPRPWAYEASVFKAESKAKIAVIPKVFVHIFPIPTPPSMTSSLNVPTQYKLTSVSPFSIARVIEIGPATNNNYVI